MAEIVIGKLLPNVTVTLNNDEIQTDVCDVNEDDCSYNMSSAKIVRPTVENKKKLYFNKDGGFNTGIDLIEQESSGILNKRAERFGLDTEDLKPSVSSLYQSMGIDINDKDSGKLKHLRLEAIHIRGVEDLETNDVFNYFKGYGPDVIEWINDNSCNVVWKDEASCTRALLNLSNPLPSEEFLESSGIRTDNTEAVHITSDVDDEGKEKMDIDESPDQESQSYDIPLPPELSKPDVPCPVHVNQFLDIPIPPGYWRVGVPHPKAKTLLLRFATKGDKKLPGAEKRSKYYQKHGNPNYGGLKGLISTSRKQKSQVEANRSAVKDTRSSFSSDLADTNVPKKRKHKTIRMRMYADDEELKIKKFRSKNDFSGKRSSVHSRLGTKHTSEELCLLGTSRNVSASDGGAYEEDSDSYYSYSESYGASSYQSEKSTGDLRSKLKRRNSDNHSGQYSRRSYETNEGSIYEKKGGRSYERSYKANERSIYARNEISSYKKYEGHGFEKNENYYPKRDRVEEVKRESQSFYKRKYRSPLCDDESDDEDESSD